MNNELRKSVDWIAENLQYFSVPADSELTFDRTLASLKPLGELVLTAEIVGMGSDHSDFVQEVLEFCWDQTERGELLLTTLTVRPDLIVLASLYCNFWSGGYRNARLERLIEVLSRTKACRNLEFPNWRRLDVLRAFDTMSLGEFPAEPERNCWFYGSPEPWIMSEDIAYAVTHDIFYLTDFGRKNTAISKRSEDYLLTWLPSWLKIFEARPNWDLVAEFLMVAQCLGGGAEFVPFFSSLAGARESDGVVPSPADAGMQLINLEPNISDDRRRFLSNYHTCLVACMAFALAGGNGAQQIAAGDVLPATHFCCRKSGRRLKRT